MTPAPRPNELSGAPDAPGQPVARRSVRVMCVDDNVDAADSLGTLLNMMGYEVAVAHDALTALAQVGEFRPQVFILDITMPHMDGNELAKRLRAAPGGDKLLLVALTALGDHASLERMADSGFDLHFTKPISPKELDEFLQTAAEGGS